MTLAAPARIDRSFPRLARVGPLDRASREHEYGIYLLRPGAVRVDVGYQLYPPIPSIRALTIST
jgi:hypothetical protein